MSTAAAAVCAPTAAADEGEYVLRLATATALAPDVDGYASALKRGSWQRG